MIEYRNAVELEPSNEIALFELAETYGLLGRVNQAVKYYNLVAKKNPKHITAYLRLAQISIMKDHLLDARSYVSKALEIDPSSVNAYHLLSGIQIKERDLNSAIDTLNKALSIDSQNIKTYISLAKLYIQTQAIEKAEETYAKAVAIDPDNRDAYLGLAKLYTAQKKWAKTEALLLEVLEKGKDKQDKFTDLASFYEGRQAYEKAEENYQSAVNYAPDKIEPLLNLAQFYTKRNLQDKALITIKNAIHKQGNNPIVHVGLSQIYLHFKMIDEADKAVDKALALDPKKIEALMQKGRVLMAKKEFKQALGMFDEVILQDKINAKAYYYRALCIQENGVTDNPEQRIFRAAAGQLDDPKAFEKDQVKRNLLAAVTIDPNFISARLKLAEIFILEKNISKAKEQMSEVLQRSKPTIKILTLLSGIHLLEQNYDEAEKILKTIIRKKPEYTAAQIRLAMLYEKTGRNDQAVSQLKSIYNRNPNQVGILKMLVDFYIREKKYKDALDTIDKSMVNAENGTKPYLENLKGEVYLVEKDLESATSYFKKAKYLDPNFIKPRIHLAELMVARKATNEALEEYLAIERINPDFIPAQVAIGLIYDLAHDDQKAEEYYRKVLEKDPTNPEVTNNLAFILAKKPDKLEEAFRLAKIAREKSPKDPKVLDTMGWVFYQKGNYLSAISELEESLKLDPRSALANFHYGMALYRTQKYEMARKYLQIALDINPNFADADIARKILN